MNDTGVQTIATSRAAQDDWPEASRKTCIVGVVIFLIVLSFWISFSSNCITFYRDDNVIATGPWLIEAARQTKAGEFPRHTYLLGGGGGMPLISIMQGGVLYPLKLIPAMILGHKPELMMNLIISFHLALFALGGWFLAARLGAPAWAGAVAAFSLGFCGVQYVGAGNSEGTFLPFTFLPWLLCGLIGLSEADSPRTALGAHLVTACSWWSIFYSGPPIGGFFAFIVVCWVCLYLVLTTPDRGKRLFKHLAVQFVLFVVLVGPLLWEAKKVYDYYGRENPARDWALLSVPMEAYLGMLVPLTHSQWQQVDGRPYEFTNLLLFCGGVPAWFILVAAVRKGSVFVTSRALCLILGAVLFVPLLSPGALELDQFLAQTPLFRLFRWPFRGLPAFHVLTILIFLVVAAELGFPRKKYLQASLVAVCLAFALVAVFQEYRLAIPSREGKRVQVVSWFVTNHFYDDPEGWDESTLSRLRSCGYVMNLATRSLPFTYWRKPRLFFTGDLGAQFKIPTVHRYIFAAQSKAYRQIGMEFSGLIYHWPAAKSFIESSAKECPQGHQDWENGIGPRDARELAEKTHVGAIVIEASETLREPIAYFTGSEEWTLLATRPSALLFFRRADPGRSRSMEPIR